MGWVYYDIADKVISSTSRPTALLNANSILITHNMTSLIMIWKTHTNTVSTVTSCRPTPYIHYLYHLIHHRQIPQNPIRSLIHRPSPSHSSLLQ